MMEVKIEDSLMKNHLPNGFYQRRELFKLPPSAKFILFLLKLKGPLNRKRIIQETMMPDRTVGFALKKLLEKELIEKVDLKDMPRRSSGKRRRRRRQDRRVTNYNLIPGLMPFGEMIP
jgi:DNA-binding transcriptional ArsR family regulator